MSTVLDTNIKQIIQEHPAAAEVPECYGIACVSCNVGTCRLRDIIEIHDLDLAREREVMNRLARAIFPDRTLEFPPIQRQQRSSRARLSPPMEKLVQEHVTIKRLLDFLPALTAELERSSLQARPLLESSLEFIRAYADRFHHAKEEAVLFRYFDENAEIFKVMHQDHERARGYVRSVQDTLGAGDFRSAVRDLEAYRQLLTEHIRKEDEVLYPWMDRNLATSQVGELYSKFAAVDAEFGDGPARQQRFLDGLARHLGKE